MTRPTDDTLLAFLEGRLGQDEREALLDRLDADPALARELQLAASGLAALRATDDVPEAAVDHTPPPAPAIRRGVSPWWIAASVAATLLVAVPMTVWLAERLSGGTAATVAGGRPESPAPSFVLVLHATWPDAGTVAPDERRRRASEYWAWTTDLARAGVLVASGDLRWEPGRFLATGGVPVVVADTAVDAPDFLVGMLALRVNSYEEALAIARECPHLRYGGSVSVRQVGTGFVTVPGTDDWSD